MINKGTGTSDITVLSNATVMGGAAGISIAGGAADAITVQSGATVKNSSDRSFDLAISAGGGGTATLQNDGTIIGTVVLDYLNAPKTNAQFFNRGTWNPAGGISVIGGGTDGFIDNSGILIGAYNKARAEYTTIHRVGTFINSGVVTLQDGHGGDTLVIDGDYRGMGGIIKLDTALGTDTSPTDLLMINGGVSGTTTLAIANIGGSGAKTATDGIKVIQVKGEALANAFSLASAVSIGAFDYNLFRGGVATDAANQNWYLRSTGKVSPSAQTTTPLPQVITSLTNATLGTSDNRNEGRIEIAPTPGPGPETLTPVVEGAVPHATLPGEAQVSPGQSFVFEGHMNPAPSTVGGGSATFSGTVPGAAGAVSTGDEISHGGTLAEPKPSPASGDAGNSVAGHGTATLAPAATGNRVTPSTQTGTGAARTDACTSGNPCQGYEAKLGTNGVGGPVLGGSGFWARASGQYGAYDPKSGSPYKQRIGFIEAGYESVAYESEAGLITLGGYGTFGYAHVDINLSPDPVTGAARGKGQIDVTGYGVGVDATWYGHNGFYADGVGQFTWYSNELSNNISGSDSGWSTALSLEVGKRIDLGAEWALTPRLQLAWTHADFSDFTDQHGSLSRLDNGDNLEGHAGLQLEKRSSWQGNDGVWKQMRLYGRASLSYEFLEGLSIAFDDTVLKQDGEKLWGDVGFGATYAWNNRWSLYAEANYSTALSGNAGGNYTVRGAAGIGYKW